MTTEPRHDRALLLDFDGTLADSLDAMAAAYKAVATRLGFTPSSQEFDRLNGPPLATVVEILRQTHSLDIGQAAAQNLYEQEVERAAAAVPPSHGARALIAAARAAEWRVGVVTSNRQDRVAGWLERQHLTVDDIVDGSLRPGKPSPAPYLAALGRLGCDATQSLAIEDSVQGHAAAAAAGLRTLLYCPLNRMPPPPKTETIESLCDAIPLLHGNRRMLRMRLATAADLPFLYALRNDPVAAMQSRTPRALTPEELHHRFQPDPTLSRKITLIAEGESGPAGMVRFDRDGDGFAVSIALDPKFRGRGLGSACLKAAINAFLAIHGAVELYAEVSETNPASDRIFQSNGFIVSGRDGRFFRYRRSGNFDNA